jgi:hypothetical protein
LVTEGVDEKAFALVEDDTKEDFKNFICDCLQAAGYVVDRKPTETIAPKHEKFAEFKRTIEGILEEANIP